MARCAVVRGSIGRVHSDARRRCGGGGRPGPDRGAGVVRCGGSRACSVLHRVGTATSRRAHRARSRVPAGVAGGAARIRHRDPDRHGRPESARGAGRGRLSPRRGRDLCRRGRVPRALGVDQRIGARAGRRRALARRAARAASAYRWRSSARSRRRHAVGHAVHARSTATAWQAAVVATGCRTNPLGAARRSGCASGPGTWAVARAGRRRYGEPRSGAGRTVPACRPDTFGRGQRHELLDLGWRGAADASSDASSSVVVRGARRRRAGDVRDRRPPVTERPAGGVDGRNRADVARDGPAACRAAVAVRCSAGAVALATDARGERLVRDVGPRDGSVAGARAGLGVRAARARCSAGHRRVGCRGGCRTSGHGAGCRRHLGPRQSGRRPSERARRAGRRDDHGDRLRRGGPRADLARCGCRARLDRGMAVPVVGARRRLLRRAARGDDLVAGWCNRWRAPARHGTRGGHGGDPCRAAACAWRGCGHRARRVHPGPVTDFVVAAVRMGARRMRCRAGRRAALAGRSGCGRRNRCWPRAGCDRPLPSRLRHPPDPVARDHPLPPRPRRGAAGCRAWPARVSNPDGPARRPSNRSCHRAPRRGGTGSIGAQPAGGHAARRRRRAPRRAGSVRAVPRDAFGPEQLVAGPACRGGRCPHPAAG